jgi:hypothetical protein
MKARTASRAAGFSQWHATALCQTVCRSADLQTGSHTNLHAIGVRLYSIANESRFPPGIEMECRKCECMKSAAVHSRIARYRMYIARRACQLK